MEQYPSEETIIPLRSLDEMNVHDYRREHTAIVIGGPTAVGKTEVACRLYDLLGGDHCELISADARQIYRLLDIGTGKLTQDELARYPHHCINIKDPHEEYSAGEFGDATAPIVERILAEGKTPIIVGGSGLYVRALCDGLFLEDDSEISDSIRRELELRLESEGIAPLYHELQKVDFVLAEKYVDLNPRRVIRALSFYYTHRIPLSQAQQEQKTRRTFSSIHIGLYVERARLYDRINARVQGMFDAGLLAETESIIAQGYAPDCNALNTVGYKECLHHLAGNLSYAEAIDHTQQSTRRYAKRQMTWFRKQQGIAWLATEPPETAEFLATLIRGLAR